MALEKLPAASPKDGEWLHAGYTRGSIPENLTAFPLSDVVAVAAGEKHTLALMENGQVVGWGDNTYRQLMIPSGATSGVIAINAGSTTNTALKSDGSVIVWGGGVVGEIPVPDAAKSGVKAIAQGGQHTLALKADGSVIAWGSNHYGQTAVPEEAKNGVTSIAAGPYHSMALKGDGSFVYWGYKFNDQFTPPAEFKTGIVAIEAYSSRFVAINQNGSVIEWDTRTSWLESRTPVEAQSGVVSIAMGETTSWSPYTPPRYVLKADGSYFVWGDNQRWTVKPSSPGKRVKSISVTGTHVAFLHEDGTVKMEGSNGYGQCVSPSVIQSGVEQIRTAYQAGAVTTDGVLSQWGSGAALPLNTPTMDLALGKQHSVLLARDGKVTAVGSDTYYESTVPEQATSGVTAIAAGDYHTLALKMDGSVIAWGAGNQTSSSGGGGGSSVGAWGPHYGQSVVPAAAKSGVIAVAAGGSCSMALKSNGSVVAWGKTPQATVPSAAANDVKAIAVGGEHAVVLKKNGAVLAWGSNTYGQSSVPQAASSDVIAIAAGTDHTIALKSDGTVLAWGLNTHGQTIIPPEIQGKVTRICAGNSASYYRVGNPPTVPSFSEATTSAGLTGTRAKSNETPFGDGTCNLLKYAFNLDLSGPDFRKLETNGNGGLPLIALDHSGAQPVWKVEYVRRRNSKLTYTAEKSETMIPDSFVPMTGTPVVRYLDARWERVTILEPIAQGKIRSMFGRVKVSAP